jgi:adenylylsulfate kinase
MAADDTGFCLWFTGLPGAGKSTIAEVVVAELRRRGHRAELLDGAEVRASLSKGLGFSKQDRDTNIRRIGYVAALLARNGVVAVASAISPYREVRDDVRNRFEHFVEVFVDTPVAVCEERDAKGRYAKARAGDLQQFTGVSDPYEPPLAPEVRVVTHDRDVAASAAQVLSYLEETGLARPGPAPRARRAS